MNIKIVLKWNLLLVLQFQYILLIKRNSLVYYHIVINIKLLSFYAYYQRIHSIENFAYWSYLYSSDYEIFPLGGLYN